MLGAPGVKVVVLYFAALRELLGMQEERLELPPTVGCVRDLATFLGQRHPALVPHFGSVRFALNETFVDTGAPLADGDVVALIPPVTGG
ncbi:MAG TPA: molybdopterin converting factor subunit 1 [Polyangiaceae bacterium]|nr:molybdopterin converting factor subunit 1 [Polyangiaceae bacterium]